MDTNIKTGGNMTHKTPKNLERAKIYRFLFQGRTFFINPTFQKKFMGFIFATVIISLGVMHGANWVFFNKFMTYGETLNLPSNHPFFRLLLEQQEYMTMVFIACSLVLSISLCTFGLFFSHRIAGPLYHLQKAFSEANKNGNTLNEIHFRHDDFFQEIPREMNQYLSRISVESKESRKVS
ncbi:hypothetical protein A9Q84_09150 [Halobacteriovorax marinus]|uniref:Methyl-accepting chemotaxis protein n=1 Tax=Halobacteriovorax marinus TaxID=97084 RepID=A0A1Y5F6Y0_9BACT|nr:hypothetical protein A9Q84_09150 [Halobacteriovorax marinus]